jgi:hypothetical protein
MTTRRRSADISGDPCSSAANSVDTLASAFAHPLLLLPHLPPSSTAFAAATAPSPAPPPTRNAGVGSAAALAASATTQGLTLAPISSQHELSMPLSAQL